MRAENKFMPPGVEQWGFVENLAAFLAGQTAMTISWPPYGRWAAGYGTDEKALDWVPKSTIAGKVGYALPPGGHPELAAGFCLSVASTSKQKDAAYLFIQWLNSEDISMQRVQLPYALRDPFRTSHFTDPVYESRWPEAKEYLATLKAGSETGLLDLSLLQTDRYEEVLRQAISKLWAGGDPKQILDEAAKQWDQTTERIGVDKQKAVYARPGPRSQAPIPRAARCGAPALRMGDAPALLTRRSQEVPMRPHSAEPRRRSGRATGRFGLLLVAPSVLILLLIGIFPLIYTLVVSFQQITMTDIDTSFAGLVNYRALFRDGGYGNRSCTRRSSSSSPLPLELVLGLLMAQPLPRAAAGPAIFIALLVLPTVIAPLIAGAVWRLLLDNRYGPVNQIVGWLWGRARDPALDGQSVPRLPRDLPRRDLAVDALHVPRPPRGARRTSTGH